MNNALNLHFALLTLDKDLHPDLALYLVEMRSGLMLNQPLVVLDAPHRSDERI